MGGCFVLAVGDGVEAHEDDLLERCSVREGTVNLIDRYRGGEMEWIAIGAGADRRKRNRLDSIFRLGGESQAVAVAPRQEFRLSVMPILPNRSDGVNHPTGWESKAWGDSCLAGWTAADLLTRFEKFRTSNPMDCAIDPASPKQ